MCTQLRRVSPISLNSRPRRPVDAKAMAIASEIVEDVREGGEAALRGHAERLGDRAPGEPLVIERGSLERALAEQTSDVRELLERTHCRIQRFAEAQRECLAPLDLDLEGGRAGHRWLPVSSVGAYAPGGRYPLPSSVLMTVTPARVAGVDSVWLASPRPNSITLAAAAVAGADGVLAVGGAQAIAALAFGTCSPPCDLLVGPGNRFVTAAKKYLVGEVGIDALAGPSELVVIADQRADARQIALDLLAQAEHDVEATAILITPSSALIDRVNSELALQLSDLETAAIASAAIQNNGLAVLVNDLDEALVVSERLAPEHLELCVEASSELADRVRNYGALFVGAASAEVFGDYGAGPNHVLPTGGGARFQAGLSVATFLRAATYLELDAASDLQADCARLARLEGLEAHARAAEARGL